MNIALPWIAGALVVFWLVGVHNRLLRLRAAAVDAVFDFGGKRGRVQRQGV